MHPDPGAPVAGYVDEHFQDLEPSGIEEELPGPEFERDLPTED